MSSINIVGIDEVGRGSLAGPLVAAAVILDKPIMGLNDSKKLTKIQREKLDIIIRESAVDYCLGITEVSDINKHGLTYAVSNAMRLALKGIKKDYKEIIIDGNYNFLPEQPFVTVIIKADKLVPSVSAASIIAKVYRDNLMRHYSEIFPLYGFESNVGYGTKKHLEMINLNGPCKLHRMFYKPLLKYR